MDKSPGGTGAQIEHLQALFKANEPQPLEMYETLQRVMRSIHLTEKNVALISYYIQRLRDLSVPLATNALQDFLVCRLAASQQNAWVEQAFVTLIWMTTSLGSRCEQVLNLVADAVRRLRECGYTSLSTEAVHASLILIWRKIDSELAGQNVAVAASWCRVVLEQEIFQSCSQTNKLKFQRKLLACALGTGDINLAEDTIRKIGDGDSKQPMMMFLRWKLAMLKDDVKQVNACQQFLLDSGTLGAPFVMACAMEYQRRGRAMDAVAMAQHVIEHWQRPALPGDVDLGPVSLSAVCLVAENANQCVMRSDQAWENVPDIVEYGQEHAAEKDGKAPKVQDEEFFNLCSDLALQACKSSRFHEALRLLDMPRKFPRCFDPQGIMPNNPMLRCRFLSAIAHVSLARSAEEEKVKEAQYREVRSAAQEVQKHIQPISKTTLTTENHHWLTKYRAVLAFDFEAVVYLRQWDDLAGVIEEAASIVDDKLVSVFFDLALSSNVPVQVSLRMLNKIVHTSHAHASPHLSPEFHTTLLPYHLRCLFQLALNASSSSSPGQRPDSEGTAASDAASQETALNLAESVLDEAISFTLLTGRPKSNEITNCPSHFSPRVEIEIETAADTDTGTKTALNANTAVTPNFFYPDEELEWLATMAFNRAVDFYLAAMDEECRRWAGKAIELANHVRKDDGNLAKLLRNNLAKLI